MNLKLIINIAPLIYCLQFFALIAIADVDSLGTDSAPEEIDLTQAIERALLHNRSIALSAYSVDSSTISAEIAKTDFNLRLFPNSAVTVGEKNQALSAGIRAVKKLSWGTELALSTSVSKNKMDDDAGLYRGVVSVEINQPLFRNFGKLVNREPIEQANSMLMKGRRSFEMMKADVIVNIVETYTDLLRLSRLIVSDSQSLERMNKLYRLTKARERQGRATRVDSLRVDLQRGQAEVRQKNNREIHLSRMKDFAELLGSEPDIVFVIKPLPFIDDEIPASKQAVQIGLENRLDYAQVLDDYSDAQRGTLIAKRQTLPSLSLITRFEQFGEGERNSDASNLDDSVWFVGLSTDSDLLKTREHLASQQKMINEASAEQRVGLIALLISRQIQQELSRYRRVICEAEIAARNFDLANSRAKLARRLFDLGRGDNFSVTDSENAYLDAENRLLLAQSEISVNAFRIRRALGTLIETPKVMKPNVVKQ